MKTDIQFYQQRRRVFLVLWFVWLLAHLILPIILPNPDKTNTLMQLKPPGREGLLGTDFLGRDVLSRSVNGGNFTLQLSLLAAASGLGLSVGIALIAELQRSAQYIINGLTRIFIGIPNLIFALLLLALLPKSTFMLFFTLVLVQLAPSIIVLRPSIRQSLRAEYVESSISMGAGTYHIIQYHIIRDLSPVLLSYGTLLVVYCIFNIAAIGFLGLMPDASQIDWGKLLTEGRQVFRYAPWIALVPGFSITITIFLLNRLSKEILSRGA